MHNVCVMARVRPPKNGIGNHINVNSEKNFIDIKEIKKDLRNNEVETSKHYIFDQVFDKDYDNDDLFNDFGMKITFNLIKNIDTTFYVYGQTGSGKTHTITGTDRIPGLLSLMIKVIKKQKLNLTFNCIQIYNNKCLDMLNDNVEIFEREDASGKIHLINIKHVSLKTESADSILNKIKKNRLVGISNQNNESSRSHLLFRINNGKHFLNILDLAGSEKAKDSVYINKDVFRENAEINKSILVLKECIRALKNNQSHIPYRGCKLTKILKDSFERKTESYILATISPEKENLSDSINTLNYISDIKLIKRTFDIVPEKQMLPVIKEPEPILKKILSVSELENKDKLHLPPLLKRDVSVPNKLYTGHNKEAQSSLLKRDVSVPNKLYTGHNKESQNIPSVNYDYRRYKRPQAAMPNSNIYSSNIPNPDIYRPNIPNPNIPSAKYGISQNCRLLMNSRLKLDTLNKEKDKIMKMIARNRTSSQYKNKLINIFDEEINLLKHLKHNIKLN